MKNQKSSRPGLGWLGALGLQIGIMTAVCLVASAAYGVNGALHSILMWGSVPLTGAWTAFRAVQRELSNYLAWIAPPACLYGAHYLLWRFAPSAGAALLCAFISLVGAAAGEVFLQRHRSRQIQDGGEHHGKGPHSHL